VWNLDRLPAPVRPLAIPAIKIADLGQRLNVALAKKVQELARYRSDFFGKLKEALGERADFQVVGDRFVFPSDVLFDSGSAELKPGATAQLDKLADALKEVETKIPPDIALDAASLLACGVITGAGAVMNTAGVEAGASVVVIGTGGVGLNAVQGAAISGAGEIVAIDVADEKLDAATRGSLERAAERYVRFATS